MSYTPTTWQTGDTITAEKLNNMESGIENANNPFVVTLTPTAEDFSGTMDKTNVEIDAAYNAEKSIIFRFITSATDYMDVPCSFAAKFGDITYKNFGAYFVSPTQNMLIFMETLAQSVTDNTYKTRIYPLTPMS